MGESKPHSKTVRGTLSNPKTQEAIQSDQPVPTLGDATSLKPENDDKKLPCNDSAPPRGQGNDSGAHHVGAPTPSNPRGELPHSNKVRATFGNAHGKQVNKTQLGDATSLKAETSKTKDMGKSTEREGQDKSGKSKL
ncbi:hypothetical protein ACEQ8H_007690 [Pleosporales sp. CAS-2024a]